MLSLHKCSFEKKISKNLSHLLWSIGKRKKKKKFLVKNIIALCPVRVFVMKKVFCDDEAVLL